MKNIKAFLINHTYRFRRFYIFMLAVVIVTFLDGRAFEVPTLVWRGISVAIWAATILMLYPLIDGYFPTLCMFIRNGFKLPTKDNYTNKSEYILPFTRKWTVGSGGFTKAEYHSGGSLGSERNAFDFNIMEDSCS